ncbi:MAG TPA: circadian clock protein KaiC, partial [Kofleriaceae bacterium]
MARARRGGANAGVLGTRDTKVSTGISGLDAALFGGLPDGRATLLFGGPGSGKTTLALQILAHGAKIGEPGIFVAFEENSRNLIANAASFGWGLAALERRHALAFLDARLEPDVVQAGAFDLRGLLATLEVKARELGARRIVFDGIDVLLAMLDDPAAERAELFRIHHWLLAQQLTGILTAKSEGADPFANERFRFAAYAADCALVLTRTDADGVSERDVSILKYRGSPFAENRAPFVIGPAGLEVAEQNPTTRVERTSTERLSTGVPRFDIMLNGGYFRAASVLITGQPGTAKSTLSGAFVAEACKRNERAVYVGFDEPHDETIRNLASVDIQLAPHIASKRLCMLDVRSLSDSAEVQLMRIRSGIRAHGASCVVIDPISALAKSSSNAAARSVIARFIHWCKLEAITLVCTSLVAGARPDEEITELGASTLCDTWVHLSYAERGGERNRAITIVKSRGTAHSNQVRELVLSDAGIT